MPPPGREGGAVRIEILRPVRLTVWGSELQRLKPGEIYDVAPAIGRVLVGDGWAMELATEIRELWDDAQTRDCDSNIRG
jgi:hypothetical protein